MVSKRGEVMSLLYPVVLWLLVPLGVIAKWYKPTTLQATIHLIILLLLTVAMARPVALLTPQKSAIESRNIVIAIDISYSMRATDITPSRYLFAKETIKSFLQLTQSDTITLIAFTSNPLLLSPPTTDYRLIMTALEQLNVDYILTKGTSLEKLFQLVNQLSGDKTLLLMTDGGDEESITPLLPYLQNLSLHILALGSTVGSTIETSDGSLLKDDNHHLVVSRVNPMLKYLSHQVEGSYSSVKSTPQSTARYLLSELNAPKQLIEKEQRSYKEYYLYPLSLALILFFMVHTFLRKYLMVLVLLLGIPLQASWFDIGTLHSAYGDYHAKKYYDVVKKVRKIKDATLESQLLLANSYYHLGEYALAKTIYLSLRSDNQTTQQMLYYNLGNLHTKQHHYSEARRYYALALQLGEDADTRFNLQHIALLKDRTFTSGVEAPSSGTMGSSLSKGNEGNGGKKSSQESSSQGASGSGESALKSSVNTIKLSPEQQKLEQLPISSKVYDVINEGYIYEKTPW
jgi:Ca-activated chloride channel family protein